MPNYVEGVETKSFKCRNCKKHPLFNSLLERFIGFLSLCLGVLCILLAIDSSRRMFGIVKWGLDVDLAIIDSRFVRRDLTESERKEYEIHKGLILSEYELLFRADSVAGTSVLILLSVGATNGLFGFLLLFKRKKTTEPSDESNLVQR